MRASRGLKWENKTYKLKRSIMKYLQSLQPLHGEIDITKFNKNTNITLTYNKFTYLLYQSTALLLPFVHL